MIERTHVLEDLHWADRSTLDLIAFLAHNLGENRVLPVGAYRGDELPLEHRLRRLVTGLLRAGAATRLELGPLGREDLETLLLTRGGAPISPALTEATVTRSEGNPFFAEELRAAADEDGVDLPHVVRDLLLQRVAQLDRTTQDMLRAAAAGRDVPYPLLRTVADAPEGKLRQVLRRAVEHGVLVGDQTAGTFRFRHALLAEAIYGTVLPGEREDLHARLAAELARSPHQVAAELAQHWAAAGRAPETLVASVAAAREAEAVAGLAEALQHLERALKFWYLVPEAPELVGLDRRPRRQWSRTGPDLSSIDRDARSGRSLVACGNRGVWGEHMGPRGTGDGGRRRVLWVVVIAVGVLLVAAVSTAIAWPARWRTIRSSVYDYRWWLVLAAVVAVAILVLLLLNKLLQRPWGAPWRVNILAAADAFHYELDALPAAAKPAEQALRRSVGEGWSTRTTCRDHGPDSAALTGRRARSHPA